MDLKFVMLMEALLSIKLIMMVLSTFMQHGQLFLLTTCIEVKQQLVDIYDIIVVGMSDVNAIIRI